MELEAHKDLIKRAVAEWNSAEGAIKAAELAHDKIILPSITELRYAGRRLIEFLDIMITKPEETDINRAAFRIDEAILSMQRAKFDAVDALVSLASTKLTEAAENNKLRSIPGLKSDLELLSKVKAKIVHTRANRHSRVEVYDELLENELTEVVNALTKYQLWMADKPRKLSFEVAVGNFSKTGTWVGIGSVISAMIGTLVAMLIQ